MTEPLQVETTGETVGEAKWHALRQLERLAPGLDKASVRFEVLSEGERGLLGVGYVPARVLAIADAPAVSPSAPGPPTTSDLAGTVRELLERIAAELGADLRVELGEDDESITATLSGDDLALVIGRHGQTIDAIQYLANVVAWRQHGERRKDVVVDAAGYRARRRAALESLAARSAERARSTGEAVALEPMTSIERRIVHLYLQELGVPTHSEGDEPYRYVVVGPAAEGAPGEPGG